MSAILAAYEVDPGNHRLTVLVLAVTAFGSLAVALRLAVAQLATRRRASRYQPRHSAAARIRLVTVEAPQ